MPQLDITEYAANENEGVYTVILQGSVDAYNSEMLSTKFDEMLKNGRYKIIVDCANLKFISSSGIGVFMSIEDDLIENRGGLKFTGVPDKILNVFKKVGLTDVFKIYPKEAQAVEDFKKGI